jgi:hypothetical protein
VADSRKPVSPATVAALWTLSNGHCYAPGCTAPVVVEVRPGVYRKNAQVAHIHGVRAGRHVASMDGSVRRMVELPLAMSGRNPLTCGNRRPAGAGNPESDSPPTSRA